MNPQNGPLNRKTSFYYPFLLLPTEQRRAMESLYRYCWAADDISDNNDPLPVKQRKLRAFKAELTRCFSGKPKEFLFQNLAETFRRFNLSRKPLLSILEGVARDLKPIRFQKFQELHRYCLQVAGGPGLASMEIFGYRDQPHRDYAKNLGVFLQIVNMTRDFREDMSLGRQYFPSEDFKKFSLIPAAIGEKNSNWTLFVEFQLNRAWSYLEKSRNSLSLRQRSRLATAEAIAAVYVKLFQRLRANPQKILEGKTSLSRSDKLLSVLGAAGRCFLWHWAVP